MSKHPTPWRVGFYSELRNADGNLIQPGHDPDPKIAARICRAINAFESPISRAERAVVRSACALVAAFEFPDGRFSPVFPSEHVDHITQAVDRLAAARAKAKRGTR